MATFLGTETYSIDDKNRVVVPGSMRRVGGSTKPLHQFVLMRGLDGCLWLYAQDDWKRLMGHAGLGKDAVLHGQVGRIEIWSPDRFHTGLVTEAADYDALAEKVLGGE
jgi:DNA-binding transcriptional regulator/RsmH inhibitor MraZ